MGARPVLVVDGDPLCRAELAGLLAGAGYGVRDTGSAREAVGMLGADPVGCAIVDVELEDMSGLDAIPLLLQVDPDLRVVVTAKGNTRDLEAKVREHDVVYYYVKGFDRQELFQAVACATAGRRTSETPKILVVDDDSDYQAAIRQVLESAGFDVCSAYSKEEGLVALREEEPDLIILDIMMTKPTDGFFFLYEMRERAEGTRPPVLSVSVISKETGMDFSPTTDGDYFPADDFLSKPVDPTELVEHVTALLKGYRPPKGDR